MTASADMLRKLAALRLDPEQMAGVLDILASLAEAEEERKRKQRERTSRHRHRNVDVTLHERDCNSYTPPDGPLSPPAPPLSPLNPPDAPMSARARLDEIEEKCRKAAGYENESSPGLCSLAPILNLMDQGISLEADILPAIKAALPRMRRAARSWDYFREPILEWHAKRTAPVVVPMVARAPPGDPQLQAQRDLMARLDEKYAKAKALAQ